ncbi:MAG: DUF4469 domain-containing protein [Prevotellaceae bacterium]|nr:DUF4469 domain-containing protein [Prevotellaceae bacterium]
MKDKMHSVIAKFVPACLPGAKKKYNAKVMHKDVLDIKGVAGKAQAYNVETPPDRIIEGFNAAMNLIFYLLSDGYSFECDMFSIGIGVPGEYSGTEERLPEGVHPHVLIRTKKPLNEYIKNNVKVIFDGIYEEDGIIDKIKDEESKADNSTITRGFVVTLTGKGLKIACDKEHAAQTGAFFASADEEETPAKAIVKNTGLEVKLIVPDTLVPDALYAIILRTQSAVTHSCNIVKAIREVRTDCILKAK